MAAITNVSLDSHPRNVFRIALDSSSLLPNYRISPEEDRADYIDFSEIPSEVTQRKSAMYNEDQVLGRSEPYKSYQFSTATTFSFTARLVAMGDKSQSWKTISTEIAAGGLGLTGRFVQQSAPFIGPAGKLASLAITGRNPLDQASSQEEIMTVTFQEVTLKAAFLEALVFPQYDDEGQAYPPPRVWLMHGQNFARRGVVKDINLAWKGPWEVSTLLCMVLEANILFDEVNTSPKGYLDVRQRARAAQQAAESTSAEMYIRSSIDNARSIAGL